MPPGFEDEARRPAHPEHAPPVAAPRRPPRRGVQDEDVAPLLAGGRVSSQAMRALERRVAERDRGEIEAKRAAIAARIPKTKTVDSEGGSLQFDQTYRKQGAGWVPSEAAPQDQLHGKQRVARYAGEDTKVGWRSQIAPDVTKQRIATKLTADARAVDSAAPTVAVDSPEVAAEFDKFEASDRTVTDYHRTPAERERSRLKTVAVPTPAGTGIQVHPTHDRGAGGSTEATGWVMDPETRHIHTLDPARVVDRPGGKLTRTHHTTPLAGAPVAGAGMLHRTDDGYVEKVTDESGHYRPEGEYTHQAVGEMQRQGLLDRPVPAHETGPGSTSAKVELVGYRDDDPRMTKGWLKDEVGIDKGNLELPYQAFLQTHGNERQARAKKKVQADLVAEVQRRQPPPARLPARAPVGADGDGYLPDPGPRASAPVGAGGIGAGPGSASRPVGVDANGYLPDPGPRASAPVGTGRIGAGPGSASRPVGEDGYVIDDR